MGGTLLFAIATAAQLALLWLAASGRGALGGKARRLQSLRLRHGASPVERDEAQRRKPGSSGTTGSAAGMGQGRGSTRAATALGSGSGGGIFAGVTASLATTLAGRLHRAGSGWSLRRYLQVSAALGLALAIIALIKTGSVIAALLLGGAGGMLLPHAALGHLIARRQRGFITKLPEAIELLVCGLRSGLPVSETLGLVTNEVPGPVGQEFKLVTERMRIGRSMEEALIESAERLGLPEFNFFCITLAIHRETGGNLTETLVNLADVLRRRAQMVLKIRALSAESRSSAMILGALPFVVFAIIWAADATYLAGFFTDRRLMITGISGLVWMSIGALVMARMVSFKI